MRKCFDWLYLRTLKSSCLFIAFRHIARFVHNGLESKFYWSASEYKFSVTSYFFYWKHHFPFLSIPMPSSYPQSHQKSYLGFSFACRIDGAQAGASTPNPTFFIIKFIIARVWFRLIDFWRFSNSTIGRNFIGVTAIILFRPFDPTGWLSKGNCLILRRSSTNKLLY